MHTSENLQHHKLADAPMLGDHLAMDLLNTAAHQDGRPVDYWQTGEDVLRWLKQNGIEPIAGGDILTPDELLAQAKALRTLAHRLISEFAAGTLDDISGLNEYLHHYHSAPNLVWNNDKKLVFTRISRCETLASLLGPVAVAVAELLTEGNATLVKQCEHPECILWFYDRTKAHKRRWCSMALCGNRHKAAQFRKRNNGLEKAVKS